EAKLGHSSCLWVGPKHSLPGSRILMYLSRRYEAKTGAALLPTKKTGFRPAAKSIRLVTGVARGRMERCEEDLRTRSECFPTPAYRYCSHQPAGEEIDRPEISLEQRSCLCNPALEVGISFAYGGGRTRGLQHGVGAVRRKWEFMLTTSG